MLTKVKIVKEFNKKKYKFSFKKTKKPNLRNNNSENNIEITVNKKKIKEFIPKSNLHFVSFVIGFYQELDIDDLNLIYLVNTCLLIKNENNIPIYEIKVNDKFKYKRFIREKVKKDFKILNKDIDYIKLINNSDNYHNYLVLIKNNSKRIKKYKNFIHCNSSVEYFWRNYFTMFKPEKIELNMGVIYNNISNQKNNYKFICDKEQEITLNEIHLSLSLAISSQKISN
tara:strand:- start:562 stop:1242 length:681 start_codon:yes stop_codon:yes gene_type:complete